MNLSLILELSYAYLCYSPSVDGVGLAKYFCTHLIYICGFSPEEDPDFVVEDVE